MIKSGCTVFLFCTEIICGGPFLLRAVCLLFAWHTGLLPLLFISSFQSLGVACVLGGLVSSAARQAYVASLESYFFI